MLTKILKSQIITLPTLQTFSNIHNIHNIQDSKKWKSGTNRATTQSSLLFFHIPAFAQNRKCDHDMWPDSMTFVSVIYGSSPPPWLSYQFFAAILDLSWWFSSWGSYWTLGCNLPTLEQSTCTPWKTTLVSNQLVNLLCKNVQKLYGLELNKNFTIMVYSSVSFDRC